MTATTQKAYDTVPYESFPYAQSHIAHLFTVGKIFNFAATDCRKCRVLELGCAAGGNIVPMADEFPGSEFYGIDLSPVQIGAGNKIVTELGLKNVKLETVSITDFPADAGKFDYIICHGVFSWVPQEVRDAIFRICRDHLTESGMAFISYNTLPGWGMVKSLRDMMVFHAKRFENVGDKLSQVLALLNFVEEMQPEGSLMREVIRQEKTRIEGKQVSYFLHEYLEEENNPLYFHEVATEADKNGLQYLADSSSFATMYLDNYDARVRDSLKTGNFLEIEQYLDFITNRRFRWSVFVPKGAAITREIPLEKIKEFYLKSNGLHLAEGSKVPSPLDNSELTFQHTMPQGRTFNLTVNNKFLAAAFLTLCQQTHSPVAFNDVVKMANETYGLNDSAAVEQALLTFGLRVLFAGGISVHAYPSRAVREVSERPLALPIARVLSRQTKIVTTAHHSVMTIDPFIACLLSLLDGTNDIAALERKMFELCQSGHFTINQDGKPITDTKTVTEIIQNGVRNGLANLAASGLLIG
ncbi:MAG: methyltransferase regulatory domain-containing protein [Thermoguttaceae bacterium]